jgi:capsular exopolysaccharide synthesis family protein
LLAEFVVAQIANNAGSGLRKIEGVRMDVPLNFDKRSNARLDRSEETVLLSEVLEQLAGFVRRQFPIFVFVLACTIALGAVYLLTTPPSFTSHAMLLIDSSKLRVLQQQDAPLGDAPIDTAQVETQVEILKSENIGLSVIKDLKLAEDPEFAGSGAGLLGRISGLFSSPKVQSDTEAARHVLAAFLARRSVIRVGRTYVLDISFTSLDAAHSAFIANAIADAYIVDQLDSKYQATRRASRWLQDRIKELRQQASDADRAVLDYKEKNNIVAIVSPGGGGSRLLGEQQLEELNTQLSSARAAAEEARARLTRITEVLKKDSSDVPVDATVADSLHSEVINRLRANYLDVAAKEAIWSARYGANHLAAVNLRTQMAEMRRSILDELGRIAQSQKSDYEIAKSRVDGLEQKLKILVADSQVTNRDALGLRDLESTAKVYHTLYDNFLQRYMEAIQQQSFPITEARIISAAAAPQHKSGPLGTVVLGIAALVGLVLSFGAAVFRDAVDRVFRSKRQVESTLHGPCLAVLPLLAGTEPTKKHSIVRSLTEAGVAAGVLPSASIASIFGKPETVVQGAAKISQLNLPELTRSVSKKPAVGSVDHLLVKRRIAPVRPIYRQVVDQPLSAFAEAFRSIKVAADIEGARVIGITSTVPGEGKSTISSNLSELIAHSGKRVILLDGDLRNPSISRSLARDAKAGILEVMNGQVKLEDAVYLDEVTGLRFLPSVGSSGIAHTNEILASADFKKLVEDLRGSHDYVIIDLSPVAPVVDVRATTQIFDSYIYVIEWGRTRINLVQHQLADRPELKDRLLGFVLNKADVRVLERYESYYGKYYYRNYYGSQYVYPPK